MDLIISHKRAFIQTTYQQILIFFENFESIFIGALFGPGTAVVPAAKTEDLDYIWKINRSLLEIASR